MSDQCKYCSLDYFCHNVKRMVHIEANGDTEANVVY